MTKKKKRLLVVVVLAVVLVALLARPVVNLVIEWLDPGQAPLIDLFKLKKNEVALVINDEQSKEKGYEAEGEIYVPASVASTYMDQRIYVDTVESSLSYVTSGGAILAQAGEVSYQVGKETQNAKKPILQKKDDAFYVSLSFIKEHTSCYYKTYQNPKRLVIMSDRSASYTMASLTEDTRVRKGPNKKYKYFVELAKGTRVFVETDKKKENDYTAVTTQDGIAGYVPSDRLQGQKETAWKFDKEPESFTQLKTKGQVCLGWHQVTNETSSGQLPSLIRSAKAMNVISPTWYALSDNTGKFSSLANSSYVTQAHAQGKQVWGLINDFGKGIKLSKVLGVTSNRNRLVNGLVATAIQHELDGINIDFEHVTKDTAPAYLEFLRELTLKCHANDLIVSVDNYSPASYNAYYDLEEQGRIVDYVILMAYDEHYNGSEESGSVSSLPFVKEGVKNVLAKVPAERTVVALPFYTRLWKEVKGKKPHPEAYGMSGAESVVRANDASPKWDEATGQYYAEFKSSGATYKIWLEEETSLKKKLEVVKKNKTAGVAFWKLGFERAVTWTTIADAVRGW